MAPPTGDFGNYMSRPNTADDPFAATMHISLYRAYIGMGVVTDIAASLGRTGANAYNGLRSLTIQEHRANRYRSRLWFILPLALNLLGGIVAYMAIRYDDPDKAKNCLLLGIGIFALLLLPLALFGLAVLLSIPFGGMPFD